MNTGNRLFIGWLMVCLLGIVARPLNGFQEAGSVSTNPDATATLVQTPDALARYTELKKKVAEGKSRITQLLLKTPTAKAELHKQALAEIDQIKRDVAGWEVELKGLVFEAFLQSPDQNREVTQEIVRRLKSLMGEDSAGGNFQPREALEMAEKMYAAGSRNPQIMLLGCQAAYAYMEFDRCQKYLDAMQQAGAKLSESYVENLKKAHEAWKAEQVLAAQDSNLPIVELETTAGTLHLELFEDQAPHAVNNFIALCEAGFYDNQPFFFVKSAQVVITGCPEGNGKGNAGYYLPDEAQRPDARKHLVGSVSLIHDQPGEDSSQFAIAYQANPERNGKFTVFGRVIEGLEIVFRMPNFTNQMKSVREPVRIVKTRVLQKRTHPYTVLEKVEIKNSANKSER